MGTQIFRVASIGRSAESSWYRLAIIALALPLLTGASPEEHPDALRAEVVACIAPRTTTEDRLRACTAAIQSGRVRPPALVNLFFQRGLARSDTGDLAGALADFDRVVELAPEWGPGYLQKAYALIMERRHDEAVATLDRILAKRMDAALVQLRGWAKLYAKQGEPLADHDQAVHLAPTPFHFTERGVVRLMLGDRTGALADHDKAIELDPTLALAHYNRGQWHFANGDFSAAAADLGRALNGRPDHPYTVIWLYLAEARAGKDTRDRLRSHAANLPSSTWHRQLIDMLLGDTEPDRLDPDAKPADAAVDRIGRHCERHFYRAQRHLIRGETAAARSALEAAVATGVHEYREHDFARIELERMAR